MLPVPGEAMMKKNPISTALQIKHELLILLHHFILHTIYTVLTYYEA